MSHNPGRRKVAEEDRRKRELAQAEEDRLNAEAAARVAAWNIDAQQPKPLFWYPPIGAALRAKRPILDYFCPGCRTVGEVDIRTFDIHPRAALSALIPRLSCSRCCPNPPFVTLVQLRGEGEDRSAWLQRRA